MNELANELESKGYNIKIQGNTIIILLGGLTNPVSVTYDWAKGQYDVGTRDLPLGIIYTFLFSISLYGALVSISFVNVFLIAVSAFGFTSLIITELRVSPLRYFIAQKNGMKSKEKTSKPKLKNVDNES